MPGPWLVTSAKRIRIMQNDIFSIILIYDFNIYDFINRQMITDWTQMAHMLSGPIKYGLQKYASIWIA